MKDAIYQGILKDGGLDIKPYPLINIGPIIYGQVRVISYNLVPNSISSST